MNIFQVLGNSIQYKEYNKNMDSEKKVMGKILLSNDSSIIVDIKGKVLVLEKPEGFNLKEGDYINLIFSKDASQNINSLISKSLGELIGNMLKFNLKFDNNAQLSQNINFESLPDNNKSRFIMWSTDLFEKINSKISNDEIFKTFIKNDSEFLNQLKTFSKSIVDELSKEFFITKLSYPEPKFLSEKIFSSFKEYMNKNLSENNEVFEKIKNNLNNQKNPISFETSKEIDKIENMINKNNPKLDLKHQNIINNRTFEKSAETSQKTFSNEYTNNSSKLNLKAFFSNNHKDDTFTPEKNNYLEIKKTSEYNNNTMNNEKNVILNSEKNNSVISFSKLLDNPNLSKEFLLTKFHTIKSILSFENNEDISSNLSRVKKVSYNTPQKSNLRFFFIKPDSKNINSFSKEPDEGKKFKFKEPILKNKENFILEKKPFMNFEKYSKISKNIISKELIKDEKTDNYFKQQVTKNDSFKIIQKNSFIKENFENKNPLIKDSISTNSKIKLPENFFNKDTENQKTLEQKVFSESTPKKIFIKFKDFFNKNIIENKKNLEPFKKDDLIKLSNSKFSEEIKEEKNIQNKPMNENVFERTFEKAVNAYKNLENTKNMNETTYMMFNFMGMPIFMSFKQIQLEDKSNFKEKKYGKLRLVLPTQNFGIIDSNIFVENNNVSLKFGLDKNIELFKTEEIKLKKAINDISMSISNIFYYINEDDLDLKKEYWTI